MEAEEFSCSDEMDFETQTDILTLLENVKCQTNNSSSQKQALIALATILNLGEENQNYFKEAGGLDEIEKQLIDGSYELSMVPVALFCFACAVKDNVTSKMEVLSRDLLLVLHKLFISVQDLACVQATAFLLACIVSGNVQGQHLALETGCVKDLLAILKGLVQEECTDVKKWMTITNTVCACISNPQNADNQRVSCCIIPYALKVVSRWSDGEIVQHALKLIGLVVLNNGSNQSRFRSCDGIDTVFNLISKLMPRLQDDDDGICLEVLISAVATLDNATAENERSAKHAFRLGAVPHILSLLHKYSFGSSDLSILLLALAHLLEYADLSMDLTTTAKCQQLMVTFLADPELPEDDEYVKLIRYILTLCKEKDVSKDDERQNGIFKTAGHQNRLNGCQSETNFGAKLQGNITSNSLKNRKSGNLYDKNPKQISSCSNILDLGRQNASDFNPCSKQSRPFVLRERGRNKQLPLNNSISSPTQGSYLQREGVLDFLQRQGDRDRSLAFANCISRRGYVEDEFNLYKDNTVVYPDGFQGGGSFLSDNMAGTEMNEQRININNYDNMITDSLSNASINQQFSKTRLSEPHRVFNESVISDPSFNPMMAMMSLQEKQIIMFSQIQTMISSVINQTRCQQDTIEQLPPSTQSGEGGDNHLSLNHSRTTARSLPPQPPPPPPPPSLNCFMVDQSGNEPCHSTPREKQNMCSNFQQILSNSPQTPLDVSRMSKGRCKQDNNIKQVNQFSQLAAHSEFRKDDGYIMKRSRNSKSMTSRSRESNSSINILSACNTNMFEIEAGNEAQVFEVYDKSKECIASEMDIVEESDYDDDNSDTIDDESDNVTDQSSSTIEYANATQLNRHNKTFHSKTAGENGINILPSHQKENSRLETSRGTFITSSAFNHRKDRGKRDLTSRPLPVSQYEVDMNQSKETRPSSGNTKLEKHTNQYAESISSKRPKQNVRQVKSIPSIHLTSKVDVLGEPPQPLLLSGKILSHIKSDVDDESFENAVKNLSNVPGKGLPSEKRKRRKEVREDMDSGFGGGLEQDSDVEIRDEERGKTRSGRRVKEKSAIEIYNKNEDRNRRKSTDKESMKPRQSSSRIKVQTPQSRQAVELKPNNMTAPNHCFYTPQQLVHLKVKELGRRAYPATVGDPRSVMLRDATSYKRRTDDMTSIDEECYKRQKIRLLAKKVKASQRGSPTSQFQSHPDSVKENKDVYHFPSGSEMKRYPTSPESCSSISSLRQSIRKKAHHYRDNQRRIRVPYSDQEILNLRHGVATLGTRWQQIIAIYQFHPSRNAVDLKEKFKRVMEPSKTSSDRKIISLPFSGDEVKRLKRGVKMFGHNWKAILAGERFLPGRTAQDLRNKWRVLSKDLFKQLILE